MKNQLLQLCNEIEKLPASEQQTKVGLMASELYRLYFSPEKLGSTGGYLQDTPPLMFIEDLRDIMFDGDGLAPDKIVADVVRLIKDYLTAQQSFARGATSLEAPVDLFIAICCDCHTDEDVRVFSIPEKAIAYCKEFVPERYEIEEQELTPEMVRDGWLFYATYGVEGDSVRVEKGQLDQQE